MEQMSETSMNHNYFVLHLMGARGDAGELDGSKHLGDAVKTNLGDATENTSTWMPLGRIYQKIFFVDVCLWQKIHIIFFVDVWHFYIFEEIIKKLLSYIHLYVYIYTDSDTKRERRENKQNTKHGFH